jgi:hypothetical protein
MTKQNNKTKKKQSKDCTICLKRNWSNIKLHWLLNDHNSCIILSNLIYKKW